MSHIFDALERETGIVIDHGIADVQRVWQHITGHQPARPYDSRSGAADAADTPTNGATAMTTLADDARNWLADAATHAPAIIDFAEHAAADISRYTSEPLVADLLAVLESGVPLARAIIEPALATAKMVAAAAPADPPAAPPAEPASGEPVGPTDMAQQPQVSGIAQ